jgi:hypothetical protein
MNTSTEKIKVKTAAKIIPAAIPNGICNVPRAILFHLHVRSPLKAIQWKPAPSFASHRIDLLPFGNISCASLLNQSGKASNSPSDSKISFSPFPSVFEHHRPYHKTNGVQWIERRQEKVRRHTQNSKRDKGKEIMLRICEIESEFLAEMIADGIQFFFTDSPLTRPILDPFLISKHRPAKNLLC